jgi:uncharacterized protein (TIGR02284 family)
MLPFRSICVSALAHLVVRRKRASEQTFSALARKVGSNLDMRRDRDPSMKDDKIIATLNELIEASKDGEKEFALAAKDAREPELARVFSDAEQADRAASAALQDQVRLLGGTAEQDGSMMAAARRSWTSVKSMMSSRDDRAMMEECERGQGDVRGHFADALNLDLPGPIHSLVERHHRAIVETHYRLLDLRNRIRDSGARALRANE